MIMKKEKKTVSFLDPSAKSNHTISEGCFSSQVTFNIGHEDSVNDAKMDYFGTKLATASSDKTVRVFDVDSRTGACLKQADLTGYDGPVLRLAWSHPKHGSLLATASYDGRVIIWKKADDASDGLCSRWSAVFDQRLVENSVNAVAWASFELGALLATASSDGSVHILSMDENELWNSEIIPKAHELGCMTVSWSSSDNQFASGGNDYTVKVWSFNEENEWVLSSTLRAHTDWVLNVEWSPMADIIASSGRDGRILLWTKNKEPEQPKWNHSHSVNLSQSKTHININVSNSESDQSDDWNLQVLQTLARGSMPYISWDPMGTFLCVSEDEKEVYIWKQQVNDETVWELVAKPRLTGSKLSVSFGV